MKPFNDHVATQDPDLGIGDYCLHGDVIVTRIEQLPAEFETLEQEPMSALAYGEVTGHVHQLQGTPEKDFKLRVTKTGERLLRVINPVALKHQEHGPIILRPGDYKTGIQREYDPFQKLIRQVAD